MPKIPEHELLRPIASGAYGQVWLARNALGTLRAVKIVRRDRFDRAEDFEREFRGLQRFEPVSRTHEALVDVLQIGRQDDWFYYVMELADDATVERTKGSGLTTADAPGVPAATLDGALRSYVPLTLRQRIRQRGCLQANEVIDLGYHIASALTYLHSKGLLHRDVKPSNILFVKGRPKLADAGLVAVVDDARSLVGTAGYIPPEGPGTPKADIYSLGKVLYEAAFGKDRQEFPQLPPGFSARPDHSCLVELNEIIARACDPSPNRRYAKAASVISDLELLQSGRSVKLRRPLRRVWGASKPAIVLTVLVVTVSVGTIVVRRGDSHIEPKNPEVKKLMDAALGVGYALDRQDDAAELFKKAIDLDPAFAPAWAGYFMCYMGREQTPEIKQKLRQAAAKLYELAPKSSESYAAQSIVKWMDWQFPAALHEVRLATQKSEIGAHGIVFARTIYGFDLLHTGQVEEAIRQFQLAEVRDGGEPFAQLGLGQAHFVKREFQESLGHYQTCLKLQRNWAGAHYGMGRVFEEQKNFLEAIQEFEVAFLVEGSDKAKIKARCQDLRTAFERGGENEYWRERFEIAQRDSPNESYLLASLYARLGRRGEAYAKLREACARKADSVVYNLMSDPSWDHQDSEFQAIAHGTGLVR
jgi:serine/threonine protein kinase